MATKSTTKIARAAKRVNRSTSNDTPTAPAPSRVETPPSGVEPTASPSKAPPAESVTRDELIYLRHRREEASERRVMPELYDLDTMREHLHATAAQLLQVAGAVVAGGGDSDDLDDVARQMLRAMADLSCVSNSLETMARRSSQARDAWRALREAQRTQGGAP